MPAEKKLEFGPGTLFIGGVSLKVHYANVTLSLTPFQEQLTRLIRDRLAWKLCYESERAFWGPELIEARWKRRLDEVFRW